MYGWEMRGRIDSGSGAGRGWGEAGCGGNVPLSLVRFSRGDSWCFSVHQDSQQGTRIPWLLVCWYVQ